MQVLETVELQLVGQSWAPPRSVSFARSQLSTDTAWRTFTAVPAGPAFLRGTARDAAGLELASASVPVEIQAGKTVSTALGLTLAFGNLAVNLYFNVPDDPERTPDGLRPTQVGAAFVGEAVCGYCHAAEHDAYRRTAHWAFQQRRDAQGRPDPDLSRSECLSCHVVGEDPDHPGRSLRQANLAPAGFDFARAASDPANSRFVGVQCESCHGPGGQHVMARTLADRLDTITRRPAYQQTCVPCHSSVFGTVAALPSATDAEVNRHGGGYYPSHAQAALYLQVGGYTYGQAVPPGAHQTGLVNGCVECHLSPAASHDPHLGGRAALPVGEVCARCHGQTYTRASLEAYQAQTRMALDALQGALKAYRLAYCTEVVRPDTGRFSSLPEDIVDLRNVASEWRDSPTAVKGVMRPSRADNPAGLITGDPSTWSARQTTFNRAYYNWRMVLEEKSFGAHAPTYAQTLLRGAYQALMTELPAAPTAGP